MNTATRTPTQERQLLDAARDGDDDAFRGLVEPYRGELQAHCYRMLGSLQDAEDALQDALLQAWRGLASFEGRSSLRIWLYRVATNTCLNAIKRRPKRVLPVDYGPSGDPHDAPAEPLVEQVWIEPYPDEVLAVEDAPAGPEARYEQRESIELSFIAALQFLPAGQRAALILREVLGFSAKEVAEMLETSTSSVTSNLQRARKAVEERLPEQSQQQTLRDLGDERLREMVDAYVEAWEKSDVDAVVEMLTEDARITMPPLPSWFAGRDDFRTFVASKPLAGGRRWRVRAISASAQPGLAYYLWEDERGAYLFHSVTVLTLRGDRVEEHTAYLDVELFEPFGLPEQLPA